MMKLDAEQRMWAESHRKAKVPVYCQTCDVRRCRAPARWFASHLEDGEYHRGSSICAPCGVRFLREVRRLGQKGWWLCPAWVGFALTHVQHLRSMVPGDS